MCSRTTGDDSPRENCYRCLRPASLCLCPLIPRIPNRTALCILQHQREQRHPLGTVRLAELAFHQLEVAVHRPKGQSPPDLQTFLRPDTALLYPDPEAPDLASLRTDDRPLRLVVPDGTWAQARVLLRHYPALASLPRVRLSPAAPGRYQVRREPRPECLSTVEAILSALRILEPETPGLDALERAFWALVEGQAERAKAQQRRRRKRPATRRTPGGAVPAIFSRAPERLVIAWSEQCTFPDPDAPDGRGVELLRLCARRLEPVDRFEAVIRPAQARPSDAMLFHMGLSHEDLEGGMTIEDFQGAWSRFLQPGDQVALWSAANQDALTAALRTQAPGVELLLKTAYCNARRGRAGPLEDLLAREGLSFAPEPFSGRAGPMLGRLLAVAQLLKSLSAQ